MGLIFTMPFIGLVLGWFFVGAILTAPVHRALLGTSPTYALSLVAVLVLGLVVVAIAARFEARVKEAVQGTAANVGVSCLALLVGFAMGFAPPFLMLFLHAPVPA